MANTSVIEPTWKRIGFTDIPDADTSGKDVGIVILDTIRPHSKIRHLGNRLKFIIVKDDFNIKCINAAYEEPQDFSSSRGEHGLMSLLQISHLPFEYNGEVHTGIAPAANFFVLDRGAFREGEGERLKKGIEWILERKDDWNIRLILCPGWDTYEPNAWIENTENKPVVYGLKAAVEAGLLVIAANGNTRLGNEEPPVEYLAVGGYIDRGSSDLSRHIPFPDEPWGRNGDGHERPDILGPRLCLPIPYCEKEAVSDEQKVSMFSGACGASSLVTGVCAHVLSRFPSLDSETLRDAIVRCGIPIKGYDNKAPRMAAKNVIASITNTMVKGCTVIKRPDRSPVIKVANPKASLQSGDPVERGLALTILAKQGVCARAELWDHVKDPSPIVRKVAIWALYKPDSKDERKLYWSHLNDEEECGVRGWWIYGLLHDAGKEEVDSWIPWVSDINWSVRWCVSEYLSKYPGSPELKKTMDPDLINEKALPVLEWYNKKLSTRVR